MQSSNNNNNFLFNIVTEGSNSGIAPTIGPLSPSTTPPSRSSELFHRFDDQPQSLDLPSTPTPSKIYPRSGILLTIWFIRDFSHLI